MPVSVFFSQLLSVHSARFRHIACGVGVLLFLFLLAPETHAQQSPHGLQERSPSSSNRSAVTTKSSSVSDDFTLTNPDGDSLLYVEPSGMVIVGSPGSYYPGKGEGFVSRMVRSGPVSAGVFDTRNPENTGFNLWSYTDGTGVSGYFRQANDTTHNAAVLAQTTSMGAAGGFEIYNDQNNYSAVFGLTQGLGPAGNFNIDNASNGSHAVWGKTNGTGNALRGKINNSESGAAAIWAQTNGNGLGGDIGTTGAGRGFNTYRLDSGGTGDTSEVVYAFQGGNGTGLVVDHRGSSGRGSDFQIKDANNPDPAINVQTFGLGHAGDFAIDNENNSAPALRSTTIGSGSAGSFAILDASSAAAGLNVSTEGVGHAASFNINNSSNNESALNVSTNGTGLAAFFNRTGSGTDFGPTVVIRQSGTSSDGNGASSLAIEHFNENNSSPAFTVNNQGTGQAGEFIINNTASSNTALVAETKGTGDVANFYVDGDKRMRIANNGDVFADGTFNGGGADVAEAFDVEGNAKSYEPGEVLVVSKTQDRTVARSGEAYSTAVVGVYATKPGVLLSEQGMETNWGERVPMGVLGVIPTKVTLEGGPIQRGDLLVTSSTPGHAMKADPDELGFGQVIGKALQPYDGEGPALIEVMVNVK